MAGNGSPKNSQKCRNLRPILRGAVTCRENDKLRIANAMQFRKGWLSYKSAFFGIQIRCAPRISVSWFCARVSGMFGNFEFQIPGDLFSFGPIFLGNGEIRPATIYGRHALHGTENWRKHQDRQTARFDEWLSLEQCTDDIALLTFQVVGNSRPSKLAHCSSEWKMNTHDHTY